MAQGTHPYSFHHARQVAQQREAHGYPTVQPFNRVPAIEANRGPLLAAPVSALTRARERLMGVVRRGR